MAACYCGGIYGALLVLLLVSLIGSRGPTTPLETRQITFTGDKKDGEWLPMGRGSIFRAMATLSKCLQPGAPCNRCRRLCSGMRIWDISPDASQLLMFKPDLNDETGRGTLWTIPVLGGSPRRLGNLTGAWRKLVSGWAFARICRFELGFCQRCEWREFQRNLECKSHRLRVGSAFRPTRSEFSVTVDGKTLKRSNANFRNERRWQQCSPTPSRLAV